MTPRRRCELLLFAACFFAFAYFNQGGGWNQNARFAEVRAMVEEGRFAIDDFLVYQLDPARGDLVRCPVTHAEYDWEGKRHRLCWVDMEWTLFPVGDRPLEPGVEKAAMVERCSSGDIGYVPGKEHFHPNKPPGTSFLAVPGYFVLYHLERVFGIDPDRWWIVDLNAWLTGVFSVGLGSAIGCVLFFRLAAELSGGNLTAALGATIALAFGTTFFPFGTIFFDHALTASLLVAAFYFLRVQPSARWYGGWAGLCGGLAVLTNYVAVGGVAILGLYALCSRRRWPLVRDFVLGGLGPAVLLCWYGWACYGSPLKTSNDFQNPLFHDTTLFMGMFSIPHNAEDAWRIVYVVKLLLWSPFRGVFWFCPILLLGVCGLIFWLRRAALRAEALVCLGIFGFFFVVNALFNGFHAGFSAGPRYLVPGLPFLALPLVVAFVRWRWLAAPLLLLSIGINLLLTATDAQNPDGVGGHARVNGHAEDTYDIIREYAWPLFAERPCLAAPAPADRGRTRQGRNPHGRRRPRLDRAPRPPRRNAQRADSAPSTMVKPARCCSAPLPARSPSILSAPLRVCSTTSSSRPAPNPSAGPPSISANSSGPSPAGACSPCSFSAAAPASGPGAKRGGIPTPEQLSGTNRVYPLRFERFSFTESSLQAHPPTR